MYHIDNHLIKRRLITRFPKNKKLKPYAVSLRKAGNLAEVLFWLEVKNGKFYGIDFDRQTIIGNYIVDFYVKSLGLVIEIDGGIHQYTQTEDAEREDYLTSLGLLIYRVSDVNVKQFIGSVLEDLKVFIIEHYAGD